MPISLKFLSIFVFDRVFWQTERRVQKRPLLAQRAFLTSETFLDLCKGRVVRTSNFQGSRPEAHEQLKSEQREDIPYNHRGETRGNFPAKIKTNQTESVTH